MTHFPPGRYRVAAVVSSLATPELVTRELAALGAVGIRLWWRAEDLPADWPDEHRSLTTGFLESPLWGELTWPGGPVPLDGPGYSIRAMWAVESKPVSPVPQPEPEGPRVGSHRWARPILVEACRQELGGVPPLHVLQWLQGVALFESAYGYPARPAHWIGHHNWGAVTCCSARVDAQGNATCPCKGFPSKDRTEKGEHIACFCSYDTDLDGARGFVRWFARRPGVLRDMTHATRPVDCARAMRDASYFGMALGPDGTLASAPAAKRQAEAEAYAERVSKAMARIRAELGERDAFAARRAELGSAVVSVVLALVGSVAWPLGMAIAKGAFRA